MHGLRQGHIVILGVAHVDVVGGVEGREGVFLPGQRLRLRQRQNKGQYRLMLMTGHTILGGPVEEFHLLAVMPELGKVVLAEHVGHHLCRQLFPDFIPRLCVSGIVKQIGGGKFIHRPAHLQPGKLVVFHHYLRFQGDKAVRVRGGSKR